VTAEAAPHHFSLTDEAVRSYDPVFKVNPPLREKADVEAVRQGLADGTLDAIATDHAPHAREDKEVEWSAAPPGMLGLETALGLAVTELAAAGPGPGGAARPGDLPLAVVVERLTAGPARCRRLPGHGGPVAPGAPANLTVFDPAARWTVDRARLASRARNTPFHGRELTGRVVHTLLRGAFTVRDGKAQR
jgi:dihydroorotase